MKLLLKYRIYYLFYFLLLLSVPNQLLGEPNFASIRVHKGVLDLSTVDLEETPLVNLEGAWEFHWMRLLDPKDFLEDQTKLSADYYPVPREWNNYVYKGEKVGPEGYATYRLLIKLKEPNDELGIKLNTIGTAFRVFINGKLKASSGKVGTTKASVTPLYKAPTINFPSNDKEVEIIIQVANFHHKRGGAWKNILFGTAEKINQKKRKAIGIDFLLAGSILIMSIYHMGLYALRRTDKVALYFSIFCFSVFIRTFITGEYLIHETGIHLPWAVALRTDYLGLYTGLTTFVLFSAQLFPYDYPKFFVKFTQGVLGLFALIVLVFTSRYYSYLVIPFQVVLLIVSASLIYLAIVVVIRKRNEGWIYLIGWTALFATIINDILYDNNLIYTGTMVHIGLFLFIFSQAFLLSVRFSKSFAKNEELSRELNHMNRNLEGIIDERTQSLQAAKDQLEQKNIDITASINYAKRIQETILPNLQKVSKYLPDTFVFLKPRDIVSGDFYWFSHIDNSSYGAVSVLAAADCTGHGVPGAFMSMSGTAFLNQIVNIKGLLMPDMILEELHKTVRKSLKQDERNQDFNGPKDGMDIGICVIFHDKKEVQFAGAKAPLIYIQEGELKVIKGTKRSIGGEHYKAFTKPFVPTTISFKEVPLVFYMVSDGYQDQFGGKRRKKFLQKNLCNLLFEIYQKPVEVQRAILEQKLNDWMDLANEKQIDDIMVLGTKLQ